MARFNTQSITTSVTGAGTVASPQAFTALNGTAPYTVALPSPVLFPGSSQTFYNATSGVVTISTPSGIFGGLGASGAGTQAIPTNTVVSITSDGTNYIVLSEDGSALVATTGSFTGNVTANGASATVSLTPQTVTIAPTGASTIDNVNIGVNTRGSGAFNTLTANSAVTLTANTTSSSTGTGSLVVTGGVGVSGAVYAAGLYGPLTGTLQTAAQPNITSTGSLTVPTLTVSGFTGLGAAPAHTTGVQWQGFTGALELNGGVGSIGATTNGLYLQGNQFWDGTIGWSAHALGASSQMLLGKGSINANVYASANANAAVGASLAGWNLSNTGFAITGGNLTHSNANPSAGVNLYIKNTTDTGGDNTRYAGIQFQIGSDVGTAAIQAYRTASASDYSTALTFLTKGTGAPATNPVERVRITSNGLVGIGTGSPDVGLTIGGAGTVGGNAYYGKLSVYGGGDENSFSQTRNEVIRMGRADITGSYYHSIWSATGSGQDSAHWLRFYLSNANGTSQTMTMQLDANGNVGIGTTSPNYAVSIGNGGSIGLQTASNSYSRLLATPSQWGYSSGYRTLILGSASSTYTTDVSGAVTLAFGVDVSGNSNGGFTGDGRELIFRNVASFITPNSGNNGYLTPLAFNNGAVGIGTASPGAKLEVSMTRTSSTSGTVLYLSDNVTGAQTNGVYKAIRSGSNGGNSVSEIRFIETDGTNNNTAIAFATAPTAGGLAERMRVLPNGKINSGGVSEYYTAGATQGTVSFYIDVPVENDDTGTSNQYHIQCSFSHASWSGYGCLLDTWVNYRGAGNFAEQYDIRAITSGNGGSWTISKPSVGSLRITKNAGTYVGGGPYWIRVTMAA